jgi:serine phosphatase RsbU (regulator of sigma subunit)
MTVPSLRKLETDLEVNKTTLHNWKKNRPKLFEFIIQSYKDREILKKHLELLLEQKELIEKEIDITRDRVVI